MSGPWDGGWAAPAGGFTSVLIRSPVSRGVFTSSLVISILEASESARLVLLAELVAHEDRGQVQKNDDDQQEDGGRVHHRLGRFDVGALEADVVDVKAQVHELAVEVGEREEAVERQLGRQLDHA